MKNPKYRGITISDFTFRLQGYGHYYVRYESPYTKRGWTVLTNDMPLIDLTKNAENPRQKNLNELKSVCKRGNIY
jgi:hypothetical protein